VSGLKRLWAMITRIFEVLEGMDDPRGTTFALSKSASISLSAAGST